MTEVKQPLRVLIYDISNVEFPEFQDQSTALGQSILVRQRAAQDRLIDTAFKQVFGVDMDPAKNEQCQFVNQEDGIVILFMGRPFLKLLEMVEEDPVMGVPTKVYQKYELIL